VCSWLFTTFSENGHDCTYRYNSTSLYNFISFKKNFFQILGVLGDAEGVEGFYDKSEKQKNEK
jgi:hypothetical protein